MRFKELHKGGLPAVAKNIPLYNIFGFQDEFPAFLHTIKDLIVISRKDIDEFFKKSKGT